MRFASLNEPDAYSLNHKWVSDPLLEFVGNNRLHVPRASFIPYFDCLGITLDYAIASDFFRSNVLFDLSVTSRRFFYDFR